MWVPNNHNGLIQGLTVLEIQAVAPRPPLTLSDAVSCNNLAFHTFPTISYGCG